MQGSTNSYTKEGVPAYFELLAIRAPFHAHTVIAHPGERRRDHARRWTGGHGRRNDAVAAQLLRRGAQAERRDSHRRKPAAPALGALPDVQAARAARARNPGPGDVARHEGPAVLG